MPQPPGTLQLSTHNSSQKGGEDPTPPLLEEELGSREAVLRPHPEASLLLLLI